MIGSLIFALWILVLVSKLGTDAAAAYKVKQEGHRMMKEGQEYFRRRNKELSHTWNLYYDERTGDLNDEFYRDGSVRKNYRTGHMYDMGRYFYNCDGYNCRHEKAPAGAELAPKKIIYTYRGPAGD
jgi:hypothetical protein